MLGEEKYMNMALKQATIAFRKGEVPIGAVVIDGDKNIIGRGYNRMEKENCQMGHAEMVAIKKACKKVGDWRLDGCTIYVTLEPCTMCFGLIRLSRIKRLVFGARSPLFGFINNEKISDLEVKEGVQREESKALLQSFFGCIRKGKEVI